MAGKTVELIGADELAKVLKSLPAKVAKKIGRTATRKGCKVIEDEAKRLAPQGPTGALKAGIKVRSMKRSRKGIGMHVSITAKTMQGDSFYGGFIEFGTKTKLKTPKIKPRLFMTTAFRSKKREALNVMLSEIKSGIDKLSA